VAAVDVQQQMIEGLQSRARKAGLADRIDARVAATSGKRQKENRTSQMTDATAKRIPENALMATPFWVVICFIEKP
jgi:hypothetical protein